jgi:hypothetical protein
MDFFPIEGANVVLAKTQDEYKEIVGFFNPHTPSINDATGQEYDSGPSITVAFKPTMKEALDLLNGKPLYLRVLGGGFPPVSLWVE